jgi:hypothetical protein
VRGAESLAAEGTFTAATNGEAALHEQMYALPAGDDRDDDAVKF